MGNFVSIVYIVAQEIKNLGEGGGRNLVQPVSPLPLGMRESSP